MQSQLNTRLDLLQSVRPLRMSRRSLTGRISAQDNGRLGFESSLERDWLLCLDFDPAVTLIREQPFSILYEFDGSERRYTPDVLAQYSAPNGEGRVIVYEVKPLANLRAEFTQYKLRFKKAIALCRENGWRFKIVTEAHIRTPFLKNAHFLRKYRRSAIQELYRDQLIYSIRALGVTTPQALLAFAYTYEEKRMGALTELWRMVASREIITNFNEPLTMSSHIWLGDGNE